VHTFMPAPVCRQTTLRIATRQATEFIDVTAQLEALVSEADLESGFVNVQTLHTTTAVVVNEHEPLLLADFHALLERLSPIGARYRHDDMDARTVNLAPGERPNGHAHCRALAQQVFDQAVERLVRAVARVVVVAAEQGNAKIARLHDVMRHREARVDWRGGADRPPLVDRAWLLTDQTTLAIDLAGRATNAASGPRGPNAARALCKESLYD